MSDLSATRSIRPASALSAEEQARLAALARANETVAKKVKTAYGDGQRFALDLMQSLMDRAIDALRTEHKDEIDRQLRVWESTARHRALASRWLGILAGFIPGLGAGILLMWLTFSGVMEKGFDAASDATARGMIVGGMKQAAEGGQ